VSVRRFIKQHHAPRQPELEFEFSRRSERYGQEATEFPVTSATTAFSDVRPDRYSRTSHLLPETETLIGRKRADDFADENREILGGGKNAKSSGILHAELCITASLAWHRTIAARTK